MLLGKLIKANAFDDYAAMVSSDSVQDNVCIIAAWPPVKRIMLKPDGAKKGLISQIIVDEAHGFVQDLDWRRNLVSLRCISAIQFLSRTEAGTLQRSLERH
jgi:hypothetical protein